MTAQYEDDCTVYLDKVLIPHNVGSCDGYGAQKTSRNVQSMSISITGEWFQIVCNQKLKATMLRMLPAVVSKNEIYHFRVW